MGRIRGHQLLEKAKMRLKWKWLPVDLAPGLRLYKVRVRMPPLQNAGRPRTETLIVGGKSPSDARDRVKTLYKDVDCFDQIFFDGSPLNVYLPEEWWELQSQK